MPPSVHESPPGADLAARRPFDVDDVVARLRLAGRPLLRAATFQPALEGVGTFFEQLVACMIPARTLEEVTLPAARRLFAQARAPAEMARLTPGELDELIGAAPSTNRRPCRMGDRARRRRAVGRRAAVQQRRAPVAPRRWPEVRQPHPRHRPRPAAIAVDVDGHRVANRRGNVETRTSEQTMAALQATLPRLYWLETNRLLVPFDKHICTGRLPHCSTCPLLEYCQQVGVVAHR
ncbi:MAG: endonuclease III [Chloroflexi bacterium]|nr:endonuclease III [Chloroflexota bacterium]